MSVNMLRAYRRVRNAVRKHRDAKGHDRCWENDLELYRVVLPNEPLPVSPDLPCKEEFLRRCELYYEQQKEITLPPHVEENLRLADAASPIEALHQAGAKLEWAKNGPCMDGMSFGVVLLERRYVSEQEAKTVRSLPDAVQLKLQDMLRTIGSHLGSLDTNDGAIEICIRIERGPRVLAPEDV